MVVDKKQIDAWKAQHGEIAVIEVKVTAEDTATCYLKPADSDRAVIARATTLSSKSQILEAGEFILQNCWLGGDERCKDSANHPKIAIGAAMQAFHNVEILEGTIKKI